MRRLRAAARRTVVEAETPADGAAGLQAPRADWQEDIIGLPEWRRTCRLK